MEGRSLQDFQRNTGFVVIVIIGGFALFVYLASTLVDVLVPLIWAAFFAVPLTGMITKIDRNLTNALGCFRSCWRNQMIPDVVSFRAKTGENCITFTEDSKEAAEALKQSLVHPCEQFCITNSRCCQSRIRITKLSYQVLEDGDICKADEVNRLVKNWRYYVKEPKHTNMQFELYLDQECQIPAVVEGFKDAQGGKTLKGSVELDRSSGLSWFCAVLVCMAFLVCVVYIFVMATALGIDSLTRNTASYGRGLEELMQWGDAHLQTLLPPEMIYQLNNSTASFAKTGLPAVARTCAADLEAVGFQVMLFMIYILFWVFEPIPMNSNVAQLIKDYLILKTVVCIVFAVLMSGLLYFLSCPLWHIFFVLSFLLNYVPEFGFMIVFALALPAVGLDANLTMIERETNTLLLITFGFVIKVLTANVLEIQMYTSLGGQFMHMHPVVLMALIIFFEKILGLTGMFLAIPIAAMIKYYVHTAEIPGCYLHPTLTFFEGDEHAAHKHFVTKTDRETTETQENVETATDTLASYKKAVQYGSTLPLQVV